MNFILFKHFEEFLRWSLLGIHDVISRYRLTSLGPLWVVVLTGFQVFIIGFVYSSIFGVNPYELIPYIVVGIVVWTFLSSTFIDASSVFVGFKNIILNHKVNPISMVLRVFSRNLFIFLHNFIVIFIALLICGIYPTASILYVIPGFLLFFSLLFFCSTLLAFGCTRFRDLGQAVNMFLNLGFLVTPIIWSCDVLKDREYIATLNPLTHVIALVRDPLLGITPALNSWLIVLFLNLTMCILTIYVFRKHKKNLLLWI